MHEAVQDLGRDEAKVEDNGGGGGREDELALARGDSGGGPLVTGPMAQLVVFVLEKGWQLEPDGKGHARAQEKYVVTMGMRGSGGIGDEGGGDASEGKAGVRVEVYGGGQ